MPAIILWIWFCAYLNCVGWTLSALHQLNAGGYAVALGVFAVGIAFFRKTCCKSARRSFSFWKKISRRFHRPFPLAFLILSGLAFLGGVLYAPTNYDALAYRLPRVLHWLDAEQWHWVHSVFDRLNNRSCGVEWVSAPVIALLHTLRPLFLINAISFLFLPGLIFSVFTRLGVRRRVAWHWMWLAPTGYCFLLQAGSIGNDLFGAVFALAAVDFALRARADGFGSFATSVLAAAMMTSAKTNNLPLLLPWMIALLPSLRWIIRRPLATLLVAALAMGASALPTIYFNLKATGDWSGARLSSGGVPHAIVYRTAANVVSLAQQNLVPPIFPMAEQWNQTVKRHLPPAVTAKTEALIEVSGCWFPLPQMQIEENGGLGFGLTVLLGASWLVSIWRRKKLFEWPEISWPTAVRWAAVLAFLALLTQSNITAIGRLFAGYYLLPLTAILTAPEHERLLQQRWWHGLAWMTFALAAALLIISPARPLFPRDLVLEKLHTLEPAHPKLARVEDVYSVYRDRPTAFAPALAELPSGTNVIGYIAFDRPEASLWQPLGTRRVIHVCPGDSAADLKAHGVDLILVCPEQFKTYFQCSLSQWLQQMNATVVRTIPLRLLARNSASDWCLVQLH